MLCRAQGLQTWVLTLFRFITMITLLTVIWSTVNINILINILSSAYAEFCAYRKTGEESVFMNCAVFNQFLSFLQGVLTWLITPAGYCSVETREKKTFSCVCPLTMTFNVFVMSSGIVLPGRAALGWAWPASSSPPPMCQSCGHPWHKWTSTLSGLPPRGTIWHLCCPSGDSPSLVYTTTSEKKTSWSDSTISGCLLLNYTSGRGWSRVSFQCKWAMERSECKPRASWRPGHGSRGPVEPLTGWGSSGHAESWFCGHDPGHGFCQRRKIEAGWKRGGCGATQPGSSWQNSVVWRLHEDRFKHGTVYIKVGTQMLSSNFLLLHFTFS